MKDKIQESNGWGSVYPVSNWGVQPEAPAEPELIQEEIKTSLLERIKTIFKSNKDEK
jgi:hypothetical protein